MGRKSTKSNFQPEGLDVVVSVFQEQKLRRRLKKGKLSTIVASKTVPLSPEELRRKKRISRTSVRNRDYAQLLSQKDKIIAPAMSTRSLLWKGSEYKLRRFQKPATEGFVFRDPEVPVVKPTYVEPTQHPLQRRLRTDKSGLTKFKTLRTSTGKLIRVVLLDTPMERDVSKKELPKLTQEFTNVFKQEREMLGFPEEEKKKRKSSKVRVAPITDPTPSLPGAEAPKARRGRPKKVNLTQVEVSSSDIPNFDGIKVEAVKEPSLPKRKPSFQEVYNTYLDQHQDRLDEIVDEKNESMELIVEKSVAQLEREKVREARKSEIRDYSYREFSSDVLEPLPDNEVTNGIGLRGTENEWNHLRSNQNKKSEIEHDKISSDLDNLLGAKADDGLTALERLFNLETRLTKSKFVLSNNPIDTSAFFKLAPPVDNTPVMVPKEQLDTFWRWHRDFVFDTPVGVAQIAGSFDTQAPLQLIRTCACRHFTQEMVVRTEGTGICVQRNCLILKHLVLSNPSRFSYLFYKDRFTVRANLIYLLKRQATRLAHCLTSFVAGTRMCNIKVSFGTRVEIFLAHNKFLDAQVVALSKIFELHEKDAELAPETIREVHALCNELYQTVSCIQKDVVLFYLYLDYPNWAHHCAHSYQRRVYMDTREFKASLDMLNFLRAKPHSFSFHPSDGANLLHLDSNYYRDIK